MAFLNIPLRAIQAELTAVIGVESMPWYNPSDFPVQPNDPFPAPAQKDYRWRITLDISTQQQSSYLTRQPGLYTGMDVVVGQWVGNISSGQAWQIISIESKNDNEVVAVVQDVYRYNTFRDQSGSGSGGPAAGLFVIFNVSDAGLPQIDPVPESGISSAFTQNIQSRFEYINLQYDFPLFQENNTFRLNDVIAADSVTNSFVLSDSVNRFVIGRITSISDTLPGWFTMNPVQKIVDNLDSLPGDIGDIIYTSKIVPGELTTTPGGSQIYIKLRNNTQSVSIGTGTGPTLPDNVFELNGRDITVLVPGNAQAVVDAVNLETLNTGVTAGLALVPTQAETQIPNISSTYGEVVLYAVTSPATATINGISVTFDVLSTDPGYEDYTRAAQMVEAINNAAIPNIVASAPTPQILLLTELTGASITIVNGTADVNGVNFAGLDSGSGLDLVTPASTNFQLTFTADDARAINFFDVVGQTTVDFGLISVENGVKACGLYIQGGLRTASTTVVTNLAQLNSLQPLIGDQAYVIDSDDGNGNNVGEWSMWLWDGDAWIRSSTEDSSSTDAKSLEYTVTIGSPGSNNIGKISSGRRVSLITVEVMTPFNGTAPALSIGYQVNNPVTPLPEISGLMPASIIDLTVADTYTTYTDILFGTDTVQGDVTITATFDGIGSTAGEAQIIVSYI